MRISDWSSDVCSSDLQPQGFPQRGREIRPPHAGEQRWPQPVLDQLRENPRSHRKADVQPGRGSAAGDRKSVVKGKSVSVRVDLGGRRIIKKKKEQKISNVRKSSRTTE